MRERTTWNRGHVTAAMTRTADPYAMNQDHLQQQPKADKYLTGDPSTFAEDITEPNTWDREYAGGTTERNEIGQPAFRGETFNHAEKTAAVMDEKTLIKKADLSTTVARMILRGRRFANADVATEAIEQQAVSLMYMPNADLIHMASRLAAQEDFPGGEFPHEQQQQAGQQQQDQQAGQQQQQAGQQDQQAATAIQQAAQQCMQAFQQGDAQGIQSAIQQMVQKAKGMAGKAMASSRRAAEEEQQQQGGQQQQQAGQQQQQQGQQAGQQQDQQAGQQQQQARQQEQQARQQQAQMDEQALEQMLAQAVQQDHQAADYDAKKGPAVNPPGYGPYSGPQAGGAKSAGGRRAAEQDQGQQQGQQGQQQQAGQQQVGYGFQQQQQGGQQQDQQGAAYQQQGGQQQDQQGAAYQQQGGQQQQQADDQLLDDMLMGPQGGGMSEVDIEMEPAQMDVGEVVLSATDDEVLRSLFANEETQDAEQAQQQTQQKQGMARTASVNPSTRTVGTRPTGGVSRVGGAPAGRSGSDVDSLTSLWPSAPDVREAFNIR